MCDLDDTGVPSIFKRILSVEDLERIFPIFDLSCEEKAVRRKWNWPRSVVYYESLKGEVKTKPIYLV